MSIYDDMMILYMMIRVYYESVFFKVNPSLKNPIVFMYFIFLLYFILFIYIDI